MSRCLDVYFKSQAELKELKENLLTSIISIRTTLFFISISGMPASTAEKQSNVASQLKEQKEIIMTHSKIAYEIIGCAMRVHQNLGPGLLESVYQYPLSDIYSDSSFCSD